MGESCVSGSESAQYFHKTNNSQKGQDVVATPRTTTLIYTPCVQAETDVDDLKMEICREKITLGTKISCGVVPFKNEWVVFISRYGWYVCKTKLHALEMKSITHFKTTHKWSLQDYF